MYTPLTSIEPSRRVVVGSVQVTFKHVLPTMDWLHPGLMTVAVKVKRLAGADGGSGWGDCDADTGDYRDRGGCRFSRIRLRGPRDRGRGSNRSSSIRGNSRNSCWRCVKTVCVDGAACWGGYASRTSHGPRHGRIGGTRDHGGEWLSGIGNDAGGRRTNGQSNGRCDSLRNRGRQVPAQELVSSRTSTASSLPSQENSTFDLRTGCVSSPHQNCPAIHAYTHALRTSGSR